MSHHTILFILGSSKPAVVRLGEHDITTTSESRSFDRQIQTYKIHERYDRYDQSK